MLATMIIAVFTSVGSVQLLAYSNNPSGSADNVATEKANVAVGPQYDSTHVYVAPEDLDRFISSFTATFGGTASKQSVATVTPTPSSTISQLVLTPVGT
jgi:spore coat protein CotH